MRQVTVIGISGRTITLKSGDVIQSSEKLTADGLLFGNAKPIGGSQYAIDIDIPGITATIQVGRAKCTKDGYQFLTATEDSDRNTEEGLPPEKPASAPNLGWWNLFTAAEKSAIATLALKDGKAMLGLVEISVRSVIQKNDSTVLAFVDYLTGSGKPLTAARATEIKAFNF